LVNALDSSLLSYEHLCHESLDKEENNISDDYAKEICTESVEYHTDQTTRKEITEIETIMQCDQEITKPSLDLSKVRNTGICEYLND
ncbi:MAG: hypothetical protein MHPSP_004613, partial [Paramarteilia canceri]